jgi:hypothetical protein
MTKRDVIFEELNSNTKRSMDELTQASNRYGPESAEVKAAMQQRALTLKELFKFRASREKVV